MGCTGERWLRVGGDARSWLQALYDQHRTALSRAVFPRSVLLLISRFRPFRCMLIHIGHVARRFDGHDALPSGFGDGFFHGILRWRRNSKGWAHKFFYPRQISIWKANMRWGCFFKSEVRTFTVLIIGCEGRRRIRNGMLHSRDWRRKDWPWPHGLLQQIYEIQIEHHVMEWWFICSI